MGTPFSKVYDAFTAKILDDEWYNWTQEEIKQDMRAILEGALIQFKFPRTSLDFKIESDGSSNSFKENLSLVEIQILACYMKIEWLNRYILTWQNLKPLYSEQDFSQANLIDKYTKLLEEERDSVHQLESRYYRSINYSPYPYSRMAGNG